MCEQVVGTLKSLDAGPVVAAARVWSSESALNSAISLAPRRADGLQRVELNQPVRPVDV